MYVCTVSMDMDILMSLLRWQIYVLQWYERLNTRYVFPLPPSY